MQAANAANRLNDLPAVYPKSFYKLQKQADFAKLKTTIGTQCASCKIYTVLIKDKECSHCSTKRSPKEIINSNHYFNFQLSQLIKLKLENAPLKQPEVNGQFVLSYADGDRYAGILQENLGKKVISLQISCDGVEVAKRSKKQIWPLFVKINELDVPEDQKVFLAACYFGGKKPPANWYLQNFVKQLNDAIENGVFVKRLNDFVYPVLLNCLFDLPARSHFLNHAGHTARFGCTICQVEGKTLFLDKNNRRKKKMIFRPDSKRVYKNRRLYDDLTSEQLSSIGINGISKLNSIRNIDCFEICSTEPMHQIFIGFVSRFLESMFSAKFKNSICSLHGKESILDKRIGLFGTMDAFKKNPRPVSERSRFSAGDHFIWFFYVSPVVLKGLLCPRGYSYWLLLVHSVSYYWCGLKKTDFKFNHNLIKVFLEDLETIFAESGYTMNSHQLLHLKDLVQRCGPLSYNNSFSYEAANGEIRSLVNAAFGVNEQIANQYQYRFNLDLEPPQESSVELKMCNHFEMENSSPRRKFFSKIVKGRKVFTSLFYQEDNNNLISRNYAVKLTSGKFFRIRYFYEEDGQLFARGQLLKSPKLLGFAYAGIDLTLNYIFNAKLEDLSQTISFSDVVSKIHIVPVFEKDLATHKQDGRYHIIEIIHKHHN